MLQQQITIEVIAQEVKHFPVRGRELEMIGARHYLGDVFGPVGDVLEIAVLVGGERLAADDHLPDLFSGSGRLPLHRHVHAITGEC